MQKRKNNRSKSSAHRRKTADHSEDLTSLTSSSSPSERHERKKVRWEGNSAAKDSADTGSEDEIESPEKV